MDKNLEELRKSIFENVELSLCNLCDFYKNKEKDDDLLEFAELMLLDFKRIYKGEKEI